MPIEPGKQPLTLGKLGFLLTRIAITTPGGGYSIIAVLGKELQFRKWMEAGKFMELFSLAQAVPGPIGFMVSIMVGNSLLGYPGAIVAGLSTLVPPAVIILLADLLLSFLPQSVMVQGAIQGAYAVAIGLVFSMTIKIILAQKKYWVWILLASLATLGMILAPHIFLLFFVVLVVVLYGVFQWKS